MTRAFCLGLMALALTGCGRRNAVDPHLGRAYPEKLSEWRLFVATRPELKPNSGVFVYDVNTPLFSDYAEKVRTVWMPPGQAALYRVNDVFAFPIGTILSKTFSFRQKEGPRRLIETRLLVRQQSGWVALPYIWNRDQTEAVLDTSPLPIPVKWADAAGVEHHTDYTIPNVNQCTVCHAGGDEGAVPLGLTGNSMNRDGQIAEWVRAGLLQGAPSVGPSPRTATVDDRARAYLDVNCASCHRPGSKAAKSGLLFGFAETAHVNACDAEKLVRSMESTDPDKMMPTLGHTVVHREAVQLMREWIASMRTRCS